MKNEITVGGKVAKIADWGDDVTSDFAGFVFDEHFGYEMVYVMRTIPTVRPAEGVYTVTSVREEKVFFKGEKPWEDEWLPVVYFTIEGWEKEFWTVVGDNRYWAPVTGDGFDFSHLTIEELIELGRDNGYDFAEIADAEKRAEEKREAEEDAYFDYLEKKAS